MALLYQFFNMGQVKLSMDKYLMAIYLSLDNFYYFTPLYGLSFLFSATVAVEKTVM